MNRQEKLKIIESIKDDFKSNESSFIVTVKGMTVSAVQGLRKDLKSKGASIKVAKNTFLKLAIEDVEGLNALSPHFKEQIAIVFTNDTPAVAKILSTTAKANEKLVVVAGTLNEKVISKSQVEFLASLPSQDILRAQVCGALKAPITGTVCLLNQLIVRLAWVIKKIEEKKANASS